jgi:hypothetical protein
MTIEQILSRIERTLDERKRSTDSDSANKNNQNFKNH